MGSLNWFTRGICLIILVSFSLSQSGCSLVVPTTTKLTVNSIPDDAEIYINGKFVGKGTGSLDVKKNRTAVIMAKRTGYSPTSQSVNTRISTTGILDIIGGLVFLVPFLGFLSPGAWTLETNNISVVLAEK